MTFNLNPEDWTATGIETRDFHKSIEFMFLWPNLVPLFKILIRENINLESYKIYVNKQLN